MRIFETHAHYDDNQFNEDREELIASLKNIGIEKVVNIGSNMRNSQTTVEFTKKYDFFYGAVGVHPSDSGDMTEKDIEILREMATKNNKIVAIGEIGLDYYWDEPDRDVQEKWFIAQANLAREIGLPIVIHSRDAAERTIEIMKDIKAEEIGGVVHCYSYSKELSKVFLDMGYYIGVGGVVTFKNGRKLKETVEYVPIEKIVIETDSPYLAPVPNRGKRNSSLNLPYVIEEIAAIKQMKPEDVAEITYQNALKMYRI